MRSCGDAAKCSGEIPRSGVQLGQSTGKAELQNLEQLIEIDWLEEERRKLSFGQPAHLKLNLIDVHARQQNYRQRRAMRIHIVQHVKSIHSRHLQIEQKQVNAASLQP